MSPIGPVGGQIRIHPSFHQDPGVRVGKETHCRLFIEALRWMARMGAPWRQLPAAYGKWTNEAVAEALDVCGQRGALAMPGRGRGPRGGPGAPAQGAAGQLPGRRGRSAAAAVGPVHAAGRLGAWDVAGTGPRAGGAGDCVLHQLRNGAPRTKKRTDALASGAALLSAGAAGGGLRDPEGKSAGPLQPAL